MTFFKMYWDNTDRLNFIKILTYKLLCLASHMSNKPSFHILFVISSTFSYLSCIQKKTWRNSFLVSLVQIHFTWNGTTWTWNRTLGMLGFCSCGFFLSWHLFFFTKQKNHEIKILCSHYKLLQEIRAWILSIISWCSNNCST